MKHIPEYHLGKHRSWICTLFVTSLRGTALNRGGKEVLHLLIPDRNNWKVYKENNYRFCAMQDESQTTWLA